MPLHEGGIAFKMPSNRRHSSSIPPPNPLGVPMHDCDPPHPVPGAQPFALRAAECSRGQRGNEWPSARTHAVRVHVHSCARLQLHGCCFEAANEAGGCALLWSGEVVGGLRLFIEGDLAELTYCTSQQGPCQWMCWSCFRGMACFPWTCCAGMFVESWRVLFPSLWFTLSLPFLWFTYFKARGDCVESHLQS